MELSMAGAFSGSIPTIDLPGITEVDRAHATEHGFEPRSVCHGAVAFVFLVLGN